MPLAQRQASPARAQEAVAKKTEGFLGAEVSFERGETVVKYDDRKVTVERLREVINSTGFKGKGVVPEKRVGGRLKSGRRPRRKVNTCRTPSPVACST